MRTIVIGVASGYHLFEKFLLLLKLFVARAKYVKPVQLLFCKCCGFEQLDCAEGEKEVQPWNCQFNSQDSVLKLHLLKMDDQWVHMNI